MFLVVFIFIILSARVLAIPVCGNGVCEKVYENNENIGENYINCPKDCLSSINSELMIDFQVLLIIIFIIIDIFLIITIIWYYRFKVD
ncbi:MAG: hypothetical protein ACE5J4_02330 [Candidatus Aenigmatarchaeota archaeon]